MYVYCVFSVHARIERPQSSPDINVQTANLVDYIKQVLLTPVELTPC